MSSIDAPDWERLVVTVKAEGDVPDAPDWERIVVGPGGTPVGGTSTSWWTNIYVQAGYGASTIFPFAVDSAAGISNDHVCLVPFSPFITFSCGHTTMYTNSTAAVSSNENFLGIYDVGATTANTATLLASTATGAIDSEIGVVGTHTYAFSSAVTLTVGVNYYYAILVTSAGGPGFPGVTNSSPNFWNPQGVTFPITAQSTAVETSLPASIAFSAMTAIDEIWLAFLST